MTIEQCDVCNQIIDELPVNLHSSEDWIDMCQDCARPLFIMIKELKAQQEVLVETS